METTSNFNVARFLNAFKICVDCHHNLSVGCGNEITSSFLKLQYDLVACHFDFDRFLIVNRRYYAGDAIKKLTF